MGAPRTHCAPSAPVIAPPPGKATMSEPFRNIRLTRDDGVATIEFARPPLNILDLDTIEELLTALSQLSPEETHLLVLRGEGSNFSSGLDVREYVGSRLTTLIGRYHGIFRRLLSVEFPFIAVVRGACLGAGLELVSVCDFAIATDDAILGHPEITLGLFPPVATIVLPRLIGPTAANELILTGRRISAAEAWDMGLLWRVVDEQDLDSEVDALIASLRSNSSKVMRLTKRAMYGRFRTRFMEELAELEALYEHELMHLEDTAEGIGAFLEKRPPKWMNR